MNFVCDKMITFRGVTYTDADIKKSCSDYDLSKIEMAMANFRTHGKYDDFIRDVLFKVRDVESFVNNAPYTLFELVYVFNKLNTEDVLDIQHVFITLMDWDWVFRVCFRDVEFRKNKKLYNEFKLFVFKQFEKICKQPGISELICKYNFSLYKEIIACDVYDLTFEDVDVFKLHMTDDKLWDIILKHGSYDLFEGDFLEKNVLCKSIDIQMLHCISDIVNGIGCSFECERKLFNYLCSQTHDLMQRD